MAAVEPRLVEWLREDARLPGLELVRRAREAGYPGGKSALYELIRRLRPATAGPVVRFEGVPGEFSQHDFGQVDVRYVSGRVERIHFFARPAEAHSGHPARVSGNSLPEFPEPTPDAVGPASRPAELHEAAILRLPDLPRPRPGDRIVNDVKLQPGTRSTGWNGNKPWQQADERSSR